MLKKLLITLFLLMALPVFAGEFEDARRSYSKIFLYLYTPECKYCKEFSPIYDRLLQRYGRNCKFVKIDANTEYGNSVMRSVMGSYVPYVILLNTEKQTLQRVTPTCLLNYSCVKDAVNKFVY